ncbi:MAG: PAS domain S-box protein [Nitrospiria bacterium]
MFDKNLQKPFTILSASLEAAADGLLVVDLKGTILTYNQRFSEMWNIPASILDAKDDNKAIEYALNQLLTPEDFLKTVRLLYSQPEAQSKDVLAFKDGKIFERHSIPLRISGKIEGRVWSFRDITEIKMTEKFLKESEERYRSIFASAALGIINLARDGSFIQVNSSFCEFLGYSQDELMKLNVIDLTHPEDLKKTRWGVMDSKHGQRVEIEKRYIRKDGKIVWGRVSSSWVNGSSGEYSVAIIQDITEHKRVEMEREQSLSLLNATLESTADAIIVLDLNLRIVSFNQKFVHLWSIPGSVMASRDGRAVLAHVRDLVKQPLPFLKKVMELQENPDRESLDQIELIDGRVIERYTLPQRIEGKSVGRVLSFRDVTEKKKIEEEHIKNEKLESLGLLAGGIAHDFNNILTAIMGNISLARASVDAQSVISRLLVEAEKASVRAKDLANQLLTFAKGGAPNKKSDTIFDILMESSEFVLRGSNVRANYIISDDLWPVEIDEGQISQVIQNLIINAQQAMPEGGTIEIRAENVKITPEEEREPFLKAGDYIKIQIRDKGMGIPPAYIQKVFDPYFTTKNQGSGLGLSISYSIIKRHEGYITVSSELGKGTTFSIFLPAWSDQVLSIKENTKSLVFGKGRVLIMDDEEPVRNVGEEILKHLGFEVVSATGGGEVLELYRKAKLSGRPFDLVILDLTIPGGMGGKETMQKLIEMDPEVKGVVSSGYSDNLVMSEFQKYGFRGIVPKPYKIEEFSQAVAAAMNSIQT